MSYGKFSRNKTLQVVHTERQMNRIAKIAKHEKVSKASVVRDLIDAGIDAREAASQPRRRG